MPEAFTVKDCALIALGTGERAQNLRELRDRLLRVHSGCIYHHFWGGSSNPALKNPSFRTTLRPGFTMAFGTPGWRSEWP